MGIYYWRKKLLQHEDVIREVVCAWVARTDNEYAVYFFIHISSLVSISPISLLLSLIPFVD